MILNQVKTTDLIDLKVYWIFANTPTKTEEKNQIHFAVKSYFFFSS